MNKLESILPDEYLKEIYKTINKYILENIENETLPYFNEKPLPQDINVVNGKHFGDLNRNLLELKASCIGAESLKWIYGSDATLLGLELKEETEKTTPIIVAANIISSDKKLDIQTAYLLDQFTPESIDRALQYVNVTKQNNKEINPSILKRNQQMAIRMLKNISEYETGINEKELREEKRKNIENNFQNAAVSQDVQNAFDFITKDMTSNEKLVFSMLNSYYVKQETGCSLENIDVEKNKEIIIDTLKENALKDSPRLTKILCQSLLFSERMTHYNFACERIYNQSDLSKELTVLPPEANRFVELYKEDRTIQNTKTQEKIHKRERELPNRERSF